MSFARRTPRAPRAPRAPKVPALVLAYGPLIGHRVRLVFLESPASKVRHEAIGAFLPPIGVSSCALIGVRQDDGRARYAPAALVLELLTVEPVPIPEPLELEPLAPSIRTWNASTAPAAPSSTPEDLDRAEDLDPERLERLDPEDLAAGDPIARRAARAARQDAQVLAIYLARGPLSKNAARSAGPGVSYVTLERSIARLYTGGLLEKDGANPSALYVPAEKRAEALERCEASRVPVALSPALCVASREGETGEVRVAS